VKLYFNFEWDRIEHRHSMKYSHIALCKTHTDHVGKRSHSCYQHVACACGYGIHPRWGYAAFNGQLDLEPTRELCPAATRYVEKHPEWETRFPMIGPNHWWYTIRNEGRSSWWGRSVFGPGVLELALASIPVVEPRLPLQFDWEANRRIRARAA
jgi:hypothetical protein